MYYHKQPEIPANHELANQTVGLIPKPSPALPPDPPCLLHLFTVATPQQAATDKAHHPAATGGWQQRNERTLHCQ
jgi:hypothetical protein